MNRYLTGVMVAALAAAGTLVVYNVDRLRDLEKDRLTAPARSAFVERWRGPLLALTAAAAVAATRTRKRRDSPASGGMIARRTTANAVAHHGGLRSGRSRSAVQMAFACTSGPAIGVLDYVMSFAFPLQGPPWDFASNPVDVLIVQNNANCLLLK